MPGGNDTPLAGPWAGLNRFDAPHELAPSESPDTTDAAYSTSALRSDGLLSRRGGRVKRILKSNLIRGVLSANFPWTRGRVEAIDAGGIVVLDSGGGSGDPQTATWSPDLQAVPSFFFGLFGIAGTAKYDRIRVNSFTSTTGLSVTAAAGTTAFSQILAVGPYILGNYNAMGIWGEENQTTGDTFVDFISSGTPGGGTPTVFGASVGTIQARINGIFQDMYVVTQTTNGGGTAIGTVTTSVKQIDLITPGGTLDGFQAKLVNNDPGGASSPATELFSPSFDLILIAGTEKTLITP